MFSHDVVVICHDNGTFEVRLRVGIVCFIVTGYIVIMQCEKRKTPTVALPLKPGPAVVPYIMHLLVQVRRCWPAA